MTKFTVIYRESGESSPKRVVLKGADESSLRRECEEKGWQVLYIRPASERSGGNRFVRTFTSELHLPVRFGVSTTELCAFCESVSKLCRIGIPLQQIIDDCIQKEGNAWFRKRLLIVRERLQGGDSLADAMEDPRCVKAFPLSLRRRVRLGEANGRLADSLKRFRCVFSFEKMRQEVVGTMIAMALNFVLCVFFLATAEIKSEPLSRAAVDLKMASHVSFAMRIQNFGSNHPLWLVGFALAIVGIGVMLWAGVKFCATRIAFKSLLWMVKIRQMGVRNWAWLNKSAGIAALVLAVGILLPFGLEVIGEASGLFNFPVSKWVKEAFAILTR